MPILSSVSVRGFSFFRVLLTDNVTVEMASTGEVASFGSDVYEAYWASLLSTTGFKPPRPRSGVLIGGSPNTPELPFIAKTLHSLGFKLYVSSPTVEAALTAIPHVTCKRIFFPTSDKRRLREVFDEYEIQSVINLAQARGKGREDEDYVARRNAVDFGLPLLNNAKCAALWVEALRRKMGVDGKGLLGYQEGNVPSEVKSWREFVGSRA